MSQAENDNLVLICGSSATGKSASLMDLKDPEGVAYLNTEANKKLPFPAKFHQINITDPMDVIEAFIQAEDMPNIHTIVIDSLTFLLDQYESMYVLEATNKMTAWGDFQQYFKQLMQQHVARSTKNVIFTAHVHTDVSENGRMETKVPVKGALKGNGIEAYFSTIVYTKKMPLSQLENYNSNLLNITADDEMVGYKHVFQTRATKDTVDERMRAPLRMWDVSETFIDNNTQYVINRLHEYYEE